MVNFNFARIYAFYCNLCKCPEGRNKFDSFPSELVFVLYVTKYKVKRCKNMSIFYSFACQYCNDSLLLYFVS